MLSRIFFILFFLCPTLLKAFFISTPMQHLSGLDRTHQFQGLRTAKVHFSNSIFKAHVRSDHRSTICMADIDKGGFESGGSSSKSRVLVKDKIKEQVGDKLQRKEQVDKEKWWRVILHDDDIHSFDYVTLSITKVVKKLTMKIAYQITMETHKAGRATVTQAWKSQAERYCLGLQQCGLTASIAPDSKFRGGEGGDGGDDGGGGPSEGG